MDVNSTYTNLEHIVESLMAGNTVPLGVVRASIAQVASCALEKYENSRGLIQRTIGLLEKRHQDAIPVFLQEIESFLDNLSSFYSLDVENASDMYRRYGVSCEMEDGERIFEKIMPLFEAEHKIPQYSEIIATALSSVERKQYVFFAINCIQACGLRTSWSKEIIDLQITNLSVLYAICKHDSVMDLCFHFASNMIDRIPLSNSPQQTRDLAESILVIGYNEHMEAQAYLCVSRAYTICHNVIAGLLYLYLAIISIKQMNRKLSKDEVFDILWLMIKILREFSGYLERFTNVVIAKFRDMHFDEEKVLWFMHSVFFLKLMNQQSQVVSEVYDFLNEHRELIIQNLDHSALPWYTLLSEIERFYPELFNEQLKWYKSFFYEYLEKSGNEKLIDILKGENLSQHLFKTILQLEKTRNSSDYALDNKNAILIANRLLPQAVEKVNIGDFILSMRVKTDFTFIFEDTYQEAMYKKLELEDNVSDDYDTPYRHLNNLPYVLAMGKEDAMLWIGKSNGRFYFLSLKEKDYKIEELMSWKSLNVDNLNSAVSGLQFVKDTTDKDGYYYPKSDQDFEEDDKSFCAQYGHHVLPIPNETQRLLIVKDVEISSIPHHLLSLSENEYIGDKMPSANVISTEFFIQSNFKNSIDSDCLTNFWIPLDSGDMALNQLWSHMENEIRPFCANLFTARSIAKPLDGELNIVCAHGANTIGETDWFYANEQPIKDVDAIVGKGKLLILLVCHAGTMNPGSYDTAVHTIIKKFIRKGYVSIVAPAWSLSTEIVPLWMKTFLDDFVNNKTYVIDAVYKANMSVKEEYKAISAWACMQLYGNPYLMVNDEPSLSLIEHHG